MIMHQPLETKIPTPQPGGGDLGMYTFVRFTVGQGGHFSDRIFSSSSLHKLDSLFVHISVCKNLSLSHISKLDIFTIIVIFLNTR